jgi:hypothetical protein
LAIAGNRHAVARPFQKQADRHLYGSVVVDDQDFRQGLFP